MQKPFLSINVYERDITTEQHATFKEAVIKALSHISEKILEWMPDESDPTYESYQKGLAYIKSIPSQDQPLSYNTENEFDDVPEFGFHIVEETHFCVAWSNLGEQNYDATVVCLEED